MSSEFCLRWNNHRPNLVSVFKELLQHEVLVDVTLAAEGQFIHAHKLVLSACSLYFKELFAGNPCQHPIVILKDFRLADLKTVVDFIYQGEVNVKQERLPHVLKAAESLRIKGLAENPHSFEEFQPGATASQHNAPGTPRLGSQASSLQQSSSLSDSREQSLSLEGEEGDNNGPPAPHSPPTKRRRLAHYDDHDSTHDGSTDGVRVKEEPSGGGGASASGDERKGTVSDGHHGYRGRDQSLLLLPGGGISPSEGGGVGGVGECSSPVPPDPATGGSSPTPPPSLPATPSLSITNAATNNGDSNSSSGGGGAAAALTPPDSAALLPHPNPGAVSDEQLGRGSRSSCIPLTRQRKVSHRLSGSISIQVVHQTPKKLVRSVYKTSGRDTHRCNAGMCSTTIALQFCELNEASSAVAPPTFAVSTGTNTAELESTIPSAKISGFAMKSIALNPAFTSRRADIDPLTISSKLHLPTPTTCSLKCTSGRGNHHELVEVTNTSHALEDDTSRSENFESNCIQKSWQFHASGVGPSRQKLELHTRKTGSPNPVFKKFRPSRDSGAGNSRELDTGSHNPERKKSKLSRDSGANTLRENLAGSPNTLLKKLGLSRASTPRTSRKNSPGSLIPQQEDCGSSSVSRTSTSRGINPGPSNSDLDKSHVSSSSGAGISRQKSPSFPNLDLEKSLQLRSSDASTSRRNHPEPVSPNVDDDERDLLSDTPWYDSLLVQRYPFPKLRALDGTVVTVQRGTVENFLKAALLVRMGLKGYNHAGEILDVGHTTLRKFCLGMGFTTATPRSPRFGPYDLSDLDLSSDDE